MALIYFTKNVAVDGAGEQLWVTDGTSAGTRLVKNLYPGAAGTSQYGPYFVPLAANGIVYFTANQEVDDGNGLVIWKTDGTANGTMPLLIPSQSTPSYQTAVQVDGTLYFFSATDTIFDYDLWKTDGTSSGSIDLAEAGPNTELEAVRVGGTIFFAASDDVHGLELWKTDGTKTGTALVKDIIPGAEGSLSSTPFDYAVANGKLFFTADDGTFGTQLWKSDGTAFGTTQLTSGFYNNSNNTILNGKTYFATAGGNVYFTAIDETVSQALWRSDGTPAGTSLILSPRGDYNDDGQDDQQSISLLTEANGRLFFDVTYYAPFVSPNFGEALWRYDPATGKGIKLADVNILNAYQDSASNFPDTFTVIGDTVFFLNYELAHGTEVWKSDGTPQGTVLVKDIAPGSDSSRPGYLTNVDGTLYFWTDPTDGPKQLWKSDGTAAGTVAVAEGDPGPIVFAADTVSATRIVKAPNGDVTVAGTSYGVENGQQVAIDLNGKVYTAQVRANAWSLTVPAGDIALLQVGTNAVRVDVSNQDGDRATGHGSINIGMSGNDVLGGTVDTDLMIGGAGNDAYYVANLTDAIVEEAGAGADRVYTSFTYTLGANLDYLVLTGHGSVNGTGNSLANRITGNDGRNVLDGKDGADFMTGGDGDDTYIFDNVGDRAYETNSTGVDTVRSSVSTTLGANVENLFLTGADNVNANGNGDVNDLRGNAGNNILDGRGSADTMRGDAGDDTYIVDFTGDRVVETANAGTDLVKSSASFTLGVNVENLTLLNAGGAINGIGNALHNVLTGNASGNILDGRGGDDTMIGGLGDDTYYVDSNGDVINELLNGGADTVRAGLTYTLGANVEKLTLTGAGTFNGTGNTLANVITGNGAANVLDGGTGVDRLAGGLGNDIYVTDGVDIIIEAANAGADLVKSSAALTLGLNLENLLLTGTANIAGTGNTLANTLQGNAGNNVLAGLSGLDKLTGGGGADTFLFKAVSDSTTIATGRDLIQDFSQMQGDRIDLHVIDADTGATGNQAFVFIGTAAFGRHAGEVRSASLGATTLVSGDVDGDGAADFSILLRGALTLQGNDFIL